MKKAKTSKKHGGAKRGTKKVKDLSAKRGGAKAAPTTTQLKEPSNMEFPN